MEDLELKFGNLGKEYLIKFLNKDKDLDKDYGIKMTNDGTFKLGK